MKTDYREPLGRDPTCSKYPSLAANPCSTPKPHGLNTKVPLDGHSIRIAPLCLTASAAAALEQMASANSTGALLIKDSGSTPSRLRTIANQQPNLVVSDWECCAACASDCAHALGVLSPGTWFLLLNARAGEKPFLPSWSRRRVAVLRRRVSPDALKHVVVRLHATHHEGLVSNGRSKLLRSELDRVRDWEALAKAAHFRPAKLAFRCRLSCRQLQRFFQIRFGTTPRAWLLHLRCLLARELLQQGYKTSAAVSELHFADASQLCHAFKKLYGRAPQTFAPNSVLNEQKVAGGQ